MNWLRIILPQILELLKEAIVWLQHNPGGVPNPHIVSPIGNEQPPPQPGATPAGNAQEAKALLQAALDNVKQAYLLLFPGPGAIVG